MDHAHDDPVSHLRRLLKEFSVAMLTTVDEQGRLRSRPMAVLEAPFDGDLWFFTGRSSPKIAEIIARPHVNVAYAGAKGSFLSISGVAELVDDAERRSELWRPEHAPWFAGGVHDPDLALLRVRVERAEYWEEPHGMARVIGGFLAGVALGQRPDLTEHEVIDLPR